MQTDTGDADTEGGVTEGWRLALRAFLLDHINEPPVTFGELLDRFGPTMPRHEIERAWHRKHKGTEIVSPNRKTHAHLHSEFHRYRLEVFGTERAHGLEWTRETRIRAIPSFCKVCGDPFVGSRKADTCSRSCANRMRSIGPAEESLGTGGVVMARLHLTSERHPELVAIETIFETLRRLPDREARERAMTYAKHLIETIDADATDPAPEPRPSVLRSNGAATDTGPS